MPPHRRAGVFKALRCTSMDVPRILARRAYEGSEVSSAWDRYHPTLENNSGCVFPLILEVSLFSGLLFQSSNNMPTGTCDGSLAAGVRRRPHVRGSVSARAVVFGWTCHEWGSLACGRSSMGAAWITRKTGYVHVGKATPRGFEPLRAEPNGFRVHLLNRSDTVSIISAETSDHHTAKTHA